jgi:hypothetical protein
MSQPEIPPEIWHLILKAVCFPLGAAISQVPEPNPSNDTSYPLEVILPMSARSPDYSIPLPLHYCTDRSFYAG